MSDTEIRNKRGAEIGKGSAIAPVVPMPGEKVSIIDVALPDAITGEGRLQAARVHISDRLACLEEDIVIVPLREAELSQVWQRVLVIDRPILHHYTQKSALDFPILPDFLTLPYCDDVVTISGGLTPGYISFRLGIAFGQTVKAEIAEACLAEVLAKTDGVDAVWITADASEQVSALAEALKLPHADPTRIIQPNKTLYKLQDIRSAESTLRPKWANLVDNFAPVLVIFCLALLITSAGMYWRSLQLAEAENRIRQDIVALVREEFLPSGPILDVRRQVTAALQAQSKNHSGKATSGPAQLLSLASNPLSHEGISLERLAWSNTEGLIMTVNVDSFASLEGLTSDLENSYLMVDVVDSNVSPTQSVTATITTQFQSDGTNQ